MSRPRIEAIPCLKDNYCYLIEDPDAPTAYLVDPSEAGPPARALREKKRALKGILLTHHHWDHVGGVKDLVAAAPDGHKPWVAGHARDRGRIPLQTVFVDAPRRSFVPTELAVGARVLEAMHIPGHTMGAIAWRIAADDAGPADIFTGDTLFAAGCGRLFEGKPGDMYESLQALANGPGETRLWFGHEYTAANLRFAASVEPANVAVKRRLSQVASCTTPTNVAEELAINPFLRAPTVDALAERRTGKDNFKA